MKYAITRFQRYIPVIDGMKVIVSLDLYSIIQITEEAMGFFPADLPFEEISELEGTEAWKYYGEVRGYRSAYSDLEGLEPDADSLAKGKRKTKVYMTKEISDAVLTLMKRIAKRHIIDEFDTRESRDKEQDLLDTIDKAKTIKDLTLHKENLLGIEMSKAQLQELSLWDDATNSRKGKMDYRLGF